MNWLPNLFNFLTFFNIHKFNVIQPELIYFNFICGSVLIIRGTGFPGSSLHIMS
jgi:hypothetical protein